MLKSQRFKNNNYKTYQIDGFPTKIFTGDTKEEEEKEKIMIKKYKDMFRSYQNKIILTDPVSSTITITGLINNVCFAEKDLHNYFETINDPYIGKSHGNFGRRTRDRKKTYAPRRKKKTEEFNSQVTIPTMNKQKDKVYNIKLFRNGVFQIPGAKKDNLTDVLFPLGIICGYLRRFLNRPDIHISHMGSVMRNCVCKMADPDMAILITPLKRQLYEEKNGDLYIRDGLGQCISFLRLKRKLISQTSESQWIKFMTLLKSFISPLDYNPMRITGIPSCNEQPGLLVKLSRPRDCKLKKELTVEILPSGEVNFDGGNSRLEIKEAYWWLQAFLISHQKLLLIDKKSIRSDDDSDCSQPSIYDCDDDLEEKMLK